MQSTPETLVLDWAALANYHLMEWTNIYWWRLWIALLFTGCLIGMTPLSTHHEQRFHEVLFVYIRKAIIGISCLLLFIPFVELYLYDMTMANQLADSQRVFLDWFIGLAKNHFYQALIGAGLGIFSRFMFKRYVLPAYSAILRKLRNNQDTDKLSDIRDESARFKPKDFIPEKYYKKDHILIALDERSEPIYVPLSTWRETNMEIIGPTRYGKGVIIGTLSDQVILNGDALFYIDPKEDKFLPHIMCQAAKKAGRKFYFLSLNDNAIGKWAPFAGGTLRDGLARLEIAFGIEFTGDAGTDFYKSQERKNLEFFFNQTRNLKALREKMKDTDSLRINAELERWCQIDSLCPNANTGFSIEKALKEDAIVYVQGNLDDSVIKTATKIFIVELIQEARRLEKAKERKAHLTVLVDEVSFIVSKQLAQALATAVGFRVNFGLAFQSQNDLLNIDDASVNPKYIHQSINVNSQLKAIYGGADHETAEWVSLISGTITKETTKMEKTEVSSTGGEIWEKNRTIGTSEEAYISINTVLSLPPKVCVFIQPRKLATVAFTSFIPVKDTALLGDFLKSKEKALTPAPVQDKSQSEKKAVASPKGKSTAKSDTLSANPSANLPKVEHPVAEQTSKATTEAKQKAPDNFHMRNDESKTENNGKNNGVISPKIEPNISSESKFSHEKKAQSLTSNDSDLMPIEDMLGLPKVDHQTNIETVGNDELEKDKKAKDYAKKRKAQQKAKRQAGEAKGDETEISHVKEEVSPTNVNQHNPQNETLSAIKPDNKPLISDEETYKLLADLED